VACFRNFIKFHWDYNLVDLPDSLCHRSAGRRSNRVCENVVFATFMSECASEANNGGFCRGILVGGILDVTKSDK
jgi:hypothetical protein